MVWLPHPQRPPGNLGQRDRTLLGARPESDAQRLPGLQIIRKTAKEIASRQQLRSNPLIAMKFKIAGIGEILWDLLPSGKLLGGAPANFAFHARQLGADAQIISRLGNDANGREIYERLRELNIPTDQIQIDCAAPTGTVTVELGADGQPGYTIHENVAWDRLVAAHVNVDAICFGTLAQRSAASREAIQETVAAQKGLKILDVNLRQRFYAREILETSLRLANTLKVNDHELPLIAEMFGVAGDARAQMLGLADKFGLQTVACTRGGSGSLLWSAGKWSEHPGIPVRVADTIGAGDSFAAAMTIGLLRGWDLGAINERANAVAAFVASQPGGTPLLPDSVRSPFLAA